MGTTHVYPFSAVVGADDMALALILTTVSPEVGGVLVRGEKGTAKSTTVRGLAAILPEQAVVAGCRFGCDPDAIGYAAGPACPDGPHDADGAGELRPPRLVELPVGATEDRVAGSLDLGKALGQGVAAFEPGLLADANRGILYVDEVNLLSDHLVDLLLDAAAMGRNTVERDGVSVSHAARFVLVGTMNPEEGELRPQLLDRFGLTVEVRASRDPLTRAEVVRRRLAFDADPGRFSDRFAESQADLRERIVAARARVGSVRLDDAVLGRIAQVCAAFDVDGMRADIVTARAAVAHAAWHGRDRVTIADVRAAARLSLPHRRRRNPFDEPGLDEDLLDQLLGDDPDPDPEPDRNPGPDAHPDPNPVDSAANPIDSATSPIESAPSAASPAQRHTAETGSPYRARLFMAKTPGPGRSGRRGRAITPEGRSIGATAAATGRVHLPATIRAAARRGQGPLSVTGPDLRRAITQGRESNLVVLCVDASGSMAARRRMGEVKAAVLSLLLDAYQRRDKVALVTFRGDSGELVLPPTGSIEVAARRLTDLSHGGRTPLVEGLVRAHETIGLERIRDPRRRPLLVVLTDGRATSGADAVGRALRVAHHLAGEGLESIVIDCETGTFRLGLARQLSAALGAEHVPVDEVAAGAIVGTIESAIGSLRQRREVA